MQQLLLNLSKVVLSNAKNHRDRLELGDHYQGSRAVRLNDISRVHETEADPAIDGRSDVAVREIHFCRIEQTLVVLNGALILLHGLLLIVNLLLRDCVLVEGSLITVKVDAS